MNENDLRVRRTKLLIFKAFDELIEEKPFSKISVKTICERAMVNRSTFYRYFDDKYDLFLYRMKEFLRGINTGIYAAGDMEQLRDTARSVIAYIDSNRMLFESLVKDNESGEVIGNLCDYIEKQMTIALKLREKNGAQYAVKPEIIALCFCETGFKLILRWLRKEMKITADEIAEALVQIITRLCGE